MNKKQFQNNLLLIQELEFKRQKLHNIQNNIFFKIWQLLKHIRNPDHKNIKKRFKTVFQEIHEVDHCLNQIFNAKIYKIYHLVIKKPLNFLIKPINFILDRIEKYKYSLEENTLGKFDFIIHKTNTKKWKILGFEQVGKDWHIRTLRKSDSREFLLDQPFFYALQIHNLTRLEDELFFTYGTEKTRSKNIIKILQSLNLC